MIFSSLLLSSALLAQNPRPAAENVDVFSRLGGSQRMFVDNDAGAGGDTGLPQQL